MSTDEADPRFCVWCLGDGAGDHAADCARRVVHPLDPRASTPPRIDGDARGPGEWRPPSPDGLWASNDPRGRVERQAAEAVFRDGMAAAGVGRLILARGFYAANDLDAPCGVLTVEIERRKREMR